MTNLLINNNFPKTREDPKVFSDTESDVEKAKEVASPSTIIETTLCIEATAHEHPDNHKEIPKTRVDPEVLSAKESEVEELGKVIANSAVTEITVPDAFNVFPNIGTLRMDKVLEH